MRRAEPVLLEYGFQQKTEEQAQSFRKIGLIPENFQGIK